MIHPMKSLRLRYAHPAGDSIWSVGSEGARIGRAEHCPIAIPEPDVSREHASVTVDGRGYLISDLGSRNGTRVNGQLVGPSGRILAHGDTVRLAGAVVLNVLMDDEPHHVNAPQVDLRAGDVWIGGAKLIPPLASAQVALLALLQREPGKVIGLATVVAAIWPELDAAAVGPQAVNTLMERLTARLREAGYAGPLGEVLPGGGVRSESP